MKIEQRVHIVIWVSGDGTSYVWSDGDQFYVTSQGGVALETFVTVGYSSPNYALGLPEGYIEHPFKWNGQVMTYEEAVEWLAVEIGKAVDALIWEEGNPDHNRENLFALVERVNWLYGEILG